MVGAHIAARGQAAVFQNTELDKPIERNEFSSARAASGPVRLVLMRSDYGNRHAGSVSTGTQCVSKCIHFRAQQTGPFFVPLAKKASNVRCTLSR